MSLKKEAFSCKNPDGYTINGCVLSQNDTDEKLPAVIISHGFTSTMKRPSHMANTLLPADVVLLSLISAAAAWIHRVKVPLRTI